VNTEKNNNVRRAGWIIALLLAVAIWCRLLPPFHVVSLRQLRQAEQQAVFDGAAFAQNFWGQKLIPAGATATDAAELFAALAKDYAAAQKKIGHSPGFSSTTSFFIQGSGRITAVEKNGVRIALDGATNAPDIELPTGLLFGNVVRDASGLLNASDFPNSQDFNAVAAALNHIVETDVIPALRAQAGVGKTIRFTGCVELDEDSKTNPWTVVPVKIDWP
jgi:predicted lipoprotein